MHEYSVTRSLVELCNQEADRNDIKNIYKIHLRVGRFTGFSPDSIRFYFDHLKVDTKCRSATIVFEEIPITIVCAKCGKEQTIEDPILVCPSCSSDRIELKTGREFYVASIEGE